MIKQSILALQFVALSAISFSQKDPVLMTVDGNEVLQSEFINIYTKNNPDPKYDKASLDEYMDLFVKYKLKVTEASNLKMDTITKFKNELNGYREQLAQPYLIDKEVNDEVIKETYYRKTNEVKAAHILLQDVNAKEASRNGKPAGEAEYKKMLDIKSEIESGKISFEDAATKYSQDPSAKGNRGVLGYFSAFQMVYPFEEAAYTTPKGQLSDPIKTRFGYHLIKVYDTRPARGQIKVAHIYTKAPEKANPEDVAKAEKKINEIYDLLKKGRDFAELAREYSEDNTSAKKGGELNWFGSGRMLPKFEDASFSLKKTGDYSKPIKTSYGFHIIKRVDYKPIPSLKEMEGELKNKISKDPRGNKSKESFIEKLKKQYKYKDYSSKWIANYPKGVEANTKAFSFKKEKKCTKINVSEFNSFVTKANVKEGADYKAVYDKFVGDYLYNYEKSQLENKYPEYKALMQEYKDGILLFELTDQKVWKMASKDTAGLRAFYEDHKSKYMWKKRADVEIYSSVNKDFLDQAMELVKAGKNANEVIKEVNQTSQLNLGVDADKFEVNEKEELKGKQLKVGVNGPYKLDSKHYFVKVDALLDPSIKKLEETRGMVISDYQNQLEKEWIDELKGKYKVDINEKVLYSLGK